MVRQYLAPFGPLSLSEGSTTKADADYGSTVGIPSAKYFGQEGLHNILVIDLLGPSLEDLFDYCGRRFTVGCVARIAKQMVSALGVMQRVLQRPC